MANPQPIVVPEPGTEGEWLPFETLANGDDFTRNGIHYMKLPEATFVGGLKVNAAARSGFANGSYTHLDPGTLVYRRHKVVYLSFQLRTAEG